MALATNKFRVLYLLSEQSDSEYSLSCIYQRKKALMDKAQQLAANSANNIFNTNNYTDSLYNGDEVGILPGTNYSNVTLDEDAIPSGEYEEQMYIIHSQDEELTLDAESLKLIIEAAKTEIEAVNKILNTNIQRDYKTFNNS